MNLIIHAKIFHHQLILTYVKMKKIIYAKIFHPLIIYVKMNMNIRANIFHLQLPYVEIQSIYALIYRKKSIIFIIFAYKKYKIIARHYHRTYV